MHPDAALIDAAAMRRWRRRGYAVHTWTVDDPTEVAALSALGVQAIITNLPGSRAGCSCDGPSTAAPLSSPHPDPRLEPTKLVGLLSALLLLVLVTSTLAGRYLMNGRVTATCAPRRKPPLAIRP